MKPAPPNLRNAPSADGGKVLGHASHDNDDGNLDVGGQQRVGHDGGAKSEPAALLASNVPAIPSLNMPKGGGAIQGIGEKYTVNLANGTGSLSVPIRTSNGRSGIQPSLSLVYDSGGGNSEFGLGWKLKGCDTITRKTSKGLPRYNDSMTDTESDVFILSGVEDLVPLFKKDAQGNITLGDNGEPQVDQSVNGDYTVRRYAPRVVETHLRIEKWSHGRNAFDTHWRVTGTDNVVTIYGSHESSRIYDTSATGEDSKRIFSWLAAEAWDPQGNAIIYNYKRENIINVPLSNASEAHRSSEQQGPNMYLKSIQYGNVAPNRNLNNWVAFPPSQLAAEDWKFSVVLDYGEHDAHNPKPADSGDWICRVDPFSQYHAGYEIRTYRLCQRVLMFHHFAELGSHDVLVSSTDFTYEGDKAMTYLTSVVQAGYMQLPSVPTLIRRSLPPVEFEYSRFPSADELLRISLEDVDAESLANIPVGLNGANYRWVDLDGEGISGILAVENQAWYYKRNLSTSATLTEAMQSEGNGNHGAKARFGPLETLTSIPSLSYSGKGLHFGDINGNGTLDIISHDPNYSGYFERDSESAGWNEFCTFKQRTNAVPDSDAKLADLTGDGLADVLVAEDQVYNWYKCLGLDGYEEAQSVTQPSNETQGPVCVFGDSESCIYLADMSGDGLVDLVRIENGSCCYWPNLGYGKFGQRIQFDNAPQFDSDNQFDHTRIRIGDIDGSGTSDVLYSHADGVDIYLNQAGNSFSDARRVICPNQSQYTLLDMIDLLGTGNSCLVWSSGLPGVGSSSIRYLDPCQGQKPHLLIKCVNNIGATTHVSYASSTKFYLDDKEAGSPWITRLPFPVHCVESIETVDSISGNTFKAHYRYKHGYYDGVEREFRGFARVDQLESSTFSGESGSRPTNSNPAWDVPPIRTATWFHTGAYENYQNISKSLSQEYFQGRPLGSPRLQDKLEESRMPTQCREGSQLREAARCMKGKVLRTETYAMDGTDQESIPYGVQQANFTVVAVQPWQNSLKHGIYQLHDRESLSVHYERRAEDPRVSHTLTLDVDAYGNVKKRLEIGYGRLSVPPDLDPRIREKQSKCLMVYREIDYTNALLGDNYRTPLPYEAREYELTGLERRDPGMRFQFDDFKANNFEEIVSMPVLPYEAEPDAGQRQRRLLRRERIQFRKDDLTTLCPVGTTEPMALPGRKLELAFSPGLLRKLYQKKSGEEITHLIPNVQDTIGGTHEAAAGYVDVDNDGHWWSTTGRICYSTSPSADPGTELAEGRRVFFMPQSFLDPFGNASFTTYDPHKMFPIGTKDAVGNTTTAIMDYRVLQPVTMIDLNGNRAATAYDALGMSAATAAMGKPADNVGDQVDSLHINPTQEELDTFFENPSQSACARLIGDASTRIVYDLTRTQQTGGPIYSAVIARENHVNEPIPVVDHKFQVSFTYSDGFGRIIQSKSRAKPSPLAEGQLIQSNLWIGTGWSVYNNKGSPVQQFEPFFDTNHKFQSNKIVGVSSTLFYDPLGRVVAKLRPDHAVTKTVYGNWSQVEFDVNDNILSSDLKTDPDIGTFFQRLPGSEYLPSWYDARIAGALGREEQQAAEKAALHHNTPTESYFDAIGRPVLIISDNKIETITASIDLDIQGNAVTNRDPLGRITLRSEYDMLSRRIHTAAMDAGEAYILHDTLGSVLMKWNSRGFRFRYASDALRRVTKLWLREGSASESLVQETHYGEQAPDAMANNLNGTPWKVRDQAGIAILGATDFKGNVLRSMRQLNANYRDFLDLSQDIELEQGVFTTSSTYDALSRPVRSVATDGTITYLTYDESGNMDQVFNMVEGRDDPSSNPTSWTAMVLESQHNADGQVTKMKYGNGVTVYRTYDPFLFRLRQIRATRQLGGTIQELHYTYDAVGNVTCIRDDAQQTIYFRNTIVEPSSSYTYDPIYRLIAATGREHLSRSTRNPVAPGAGDDTHRGFISPGDGNAMGRYLETYSYDKVGNILEMQHIGSDPQNPGWKRTYTYAEQSALEPGVVGNRLSSTTVGSSIERYGYRGTAGLTGNMTSMSALPTMIWDFADQLRATAKQVVNQGLPEKTYYVYDSQGERIRKVTESQAGPNSNEKPIRIKERIYLGGHEIFRKYGSNGHDVSLERTTFHVGDDSGRVVDIERRTLGTDDGVGLQLRFQLSNMLGTACIELDDTGQVLSYEEYFPYGSTSYQAVANQTDVAKRYRYTGKELDTENGLYFFGARYYAAWIGRWTSCDPLGGPRNNYNFVSCNPIHLTDPDGRQGSPASKKRGGATFANQSGVLIHEILTLVLRTRLALIGVPSVGPLATRVGGSKNNPFDESTSTGRPGTLDIAPLALQWGGTYEANIYEFKPEAQTPRDSKSYARSSETQLYARYYPLGVNSTGQNVSSAKVGTMLEDLAMIKPSLLDPVKFSNAAVDIEIKMRLPEDKSKGNKKIAGLVTYSLEAKVKNKKGNEQRQVLQALEEFRDQLRQPGIPPVNNPHPPLWVPLNDGKTGKPGDKGGEKQAPQEKPKIEWAPPANDNAEKPEKETSPEDIAAMIGLGLLLIIIIIIMKGKGLPQPAPATVPIAAAPSSSPAALALANIDTPGGRMPTTFNAGSSVQFGAMDMSGAAGADPSTAGGFRIRW